MKIISKIFPMMKQEIYTKQATNLPKLMEMHGIISDVIPVAPRQLAEVSYSGASVTPGLELSPVNTKDEPTVTWNWQNSTYYLLCMLDPDAPSRKSPGLREFHHWLVGNIPEGNVHQGEVFSQYIGPAPLEHSGLHRYLFLIYKQSKPMHFKFQRLNNKSSHRRSNFSIAEIARKYELSDPVAGNFFHAEWDEFVTPPDTLQNAEFL